MANNNSFTAAQYGKIFSGDILHRTSRSLFISIKIFPRNMRYFFCLSYLFGRALDSITDNQAISISNRVKVLDGLKDVIKKCETSKIKIHSIIQPVLPFFSNKDEFELVFKIPELISWLNVMPEKEKNDIHHIIDNLFLGDEFDLRIFNDSTKILALGKDTDLLQYCYYQFGSEIEILTETLFRNIKNFSNANIKKMQGLGKQYGVAMQLINIMRDLPSDLSQGRCYIPEDQLNSVGATPDSILTNPKKIIPILNYWHIQIINGLDSGVDYLLGINNIRAKYSCAIALLISMKSFELLKNISYIKLDQKVRLARKEVKKLIFIAIMCTISNKFLGQYYSKHRKLLTVPIKNN